nr:ribonuclease H-like domain-containing protein [Tanacetum cinerariifolium]
NFKLLDDANILLRTHRQHNMYSIDLNNIVPHKDLTCLVAKASADECTLWHMRLGHLNVKTMNKLVRHNLVRGLPTKSFDNDHTCTACLKGKQHKASCKSKIYNRRTKKIMETMNVSFDELSAMAFEQSSSKPGLQCMTYGQISSGLDLTYAPPTITKQQPTEGELDLLFEAMYDDYFGGQPLATVVNVPPAQEPQVR